MGSARHAMVGGEEPEQVGLVASSSSPEIFDGKSAPEVSEDLKQHPRPVAAVAQLAEVGEWLLWGTHGAFQLGQLIACGRKRFAIKAYSPQ